MSATSRTLPAGAWIALWTAVFAPQFVLMIQHRRAIATVLPRFVPGLLGVVGVMAGVALLAVGVAALAMLVRDRRATGRPA